LAVGRVVRPLSCLSACEEAAASQLVPLFTGEPTPHQVGARGTVRRGREAVQGRGNGGTLNSWRGRAKAQFQNGMFLT